MGKLITNIAFIAVVLFSAFCVIYYNSGFFDKNANEGDAALALANDRPQFARGYSAFELAELGQKANPNYVISFPKDHFSHDAFDIEWWYLTANLQDEQGKPYALQWTLFRFRNPNATSEKPSSWNDKHIYMAHASVHSESQHWFSEKFARGDVGNAGTEQSPFTLFIDEWLWINNAPASATGDIAQQGLLPADLSFNANLINSNDGSQQTAGVQQIAGAQQKLNVTLNLSNAGPYVMQGENGYSIKSADGRYASHYYSAPFIDVQGSLDYTLNGSKISKRVKGNAWFDQEWTSQLLDRKTLGWDWLSLHLDNGDKVMAFRMRIDGQESYVTGSYIQSNGAVQSLKPADLTLTVSKQTSVGDKQLPLHWTLDIPSRNIQLSIRSSKDDQWNPALVSYYEGSVAVSGSHTGLGFLELTGY